MSQSDYIRHKKMANILRDQENLGNVLNAQDLTHFKTFQLSNTIFDSNVTINNHILPENTQIVFNIEMDTSGNCPNIAFCTGTDKRANRTKQNIPMFSHYRGKISKNEYFWGKKNKHQLCLQKEFQECDSFLYKRHQYNKI